jgi:hypothetical protein
MNSYSNTPQESCAQGPDSLESAPPWYTEASADPAADARHERPILSLAPGSECPRYQTLADVPDELRTRGSWKRAGLKIKKGVAPRGELRNPDGEFTWDKLYAVQDTERVKLSVADQWRDLYWKLFVKDHNQNEPQRYIWWSKTRDDWVTVKARSGTQVVGGQYRSPYLRRGDIKNHLACLDIYGVFGGPVTRWLAIDLDRHDLARNPVTPAHTAVFLAQFRVLLDEFWGKEGCHFQVKEQDAEGVHLFLILPGKTPLAEAARGLRERLKALDDRHPELAARARVLGMRTLAALEVYPDPNNGFRLPLGTGRTMLLDRPLSFVPNRRRRLVQDVPGYMGWLRDPAKKYMLPDEVVRYLEGRLKPEPAPATPQTPVPCRQPRQTSRHGRATSSIPHKLKGCYRETMIDYWESRLVEPNMLDAMILVTARILPFQNKDEEEGIQVLDGLVDGLTDLRVSSRLGSARGRAQIDKTIRQAARLAYRIEPSLQSEKLRKAAAAFERRGFRLDDRSTWHRKSDFAWDASELAIIEREVLPMFPAANLEEVAAALKHFLKYMHGKASGEVAIKMFHLPFSRYPSITLGNTAKRTVFKNKLLEVGWLYIRAGHFPGTAGRKGRATAYAVAGSVSRKLSQPQPAEACISDADFEEGGPDWQIGATASEQYALSSSS